LDSYTLQRAMQDGMGVSKTIDWAATTVRYTKRTRSIDDGRRRVFLFSIMREFKNSLRMNGMEEDANLHSGNIDDTRLIKVAGKKPTTMNCPTC
jgi:hypothetical protein